MNAPADELIASISPPSGLQATINGESRTQMFDRNAFAQAKPSRARPNWGRVLALESQLSALRIQLQDIKDRAWKWNLFCLTVGALIGVLVDAAVRAL